MWRIQVVKIHLSGRPQEPGSKLWRNPFVYVNHSPPRCLFPYQHPQPRETRVYSRLDMSPIEKRLCLEFMLVNCPECISGVSCRYLVRFVERGVEFAGPKIDRCVGFFSHLASTPRALLPDSPIGLSIANRLVIRFLQQGHLYQPSSPMHLPVVEISDRKS